jgi:ketosteroid isomerase-like protein
MIDDIDRPDVVHQVTAELLRYENALVADDVETLIEQFWDSELTIRFGPTESLHGAAEIAAFRRTRTQGDLARDVERVQVTAFGDDVAIATVEYTRRSNGQRGRQSQTWVRTSAGWRIVLAHVSTLQV